MNVGIYIYDRAEVLDFAGPFEVFSTATRIADGERPYDVFLLAESDNPVTARGGFRVVPDHGFHDHPSLDLLIVAGGVHTGELDKPVVIEWIARQAERASLVASVCTGAFLLARAGLLDGRRVTTHWEDVADLRAGFPQLDVVEGVRWVDEGDVVTSGGISAGIDMSLHLVARTAGEDLALRTARQMEFAWTRA